MVDTDRFVEPTGGTDQPMALKACLGLIAGLALVKLAIHLITNILGGYGIFRDELYYLACTRHLGLGYVDQPPLSIYLLAANSWLFGESVFALRFLPALFGSLTVLLIGLLTRELGGGRWAQLLAGLASLVSLIFLAMDSVYSMNAFDHLVWAAVALLVARLLRTGQPAYWPLIGIAVGLGLLNKVGVLWLGAGIAVGLLATRERRWLGTRWPWLAGLLALALFFPYVWWNLTHDMAHLEFIRNATAGKYSGLSAQTFVFDQFLVQNPVTVPVWGSGLIFLLFSPSGRRFRMLGWIYLASLLILLANGHSKAEYLSPAYAILFAAGGVALERWLGRPARAWARVVIAILLLGGLILAPVVVPILPVDTYIAYAETLGIEPSTSENKELAELPQFYADRFGWEEKAAAVAQVYDSLPPEDREVAAVFGENYGRAGAIDHFGPGLGLPYAISPHNSYWLWGPRHFTGEVVIVLGGEREGLESSFESVEWAGQVPCRLCMPYESDLPIFVCRDLKLPITEVWERLKNYS
ncbi:MAG: glycosyltransferase family 39 protein [Thermoanaerobaculia bacterium]